MDYSAAKRLNLIPKTINKINPALRNSKANHSGQCSGD
jgi:hypothetical protein